MPQVWGLATLPLLPHANQRELNCLQVNYVITGGDAEAFYPELCRYLEQSGDYELVGRHDYISKLAGSAETWKRFRRKVVLPVSAYQPD